MTFSIFLDVECLDYSKLFSKNTAKVSDVAKMLDVSPVQCERT